jgi:pimeloyl-ACP methyl ester carboxylesterase
VVLLHGYLENLKMWEAVSRELSGNYKVVLIDLPGHGKSKTYGKIHTMEFMAEEVNEVLEELKIKKAVVIGHSMGGYVTLALAELFPEKIIAFILQNSTSLPDSDEKKEQRLKAVKAAHKNLETLIKMSIPNLFAEKNLKELKPEIEFTKKLAQETSAEGVEAALRGMRERPDRTFVLQNSQGKTGIIIGKFDKAVNPEELKKVIPGKENIEVEILETGHMAHLEDFESTLKFFKKFLARVYG